MVIVVVSPEVLEAFTRPALDLVTGQLVELAPAKGIPVQLELPFGNTMPAQVLPEWATNYRCYSTGGTNHEI